MRPPLKARARMLRQRIILTVRFYFRVPVDDIREQERERIDRQVAEALATQDRIMRQLHARLSWYERRVPTIAKQYSAYCKEQRKLLKAEQRAAPETTG